MENGNFYKEYNVIENNNKSVSFISKSRALFEKHIGIRLSKIGHFFKKLGNKFKEKFVIDDEPTVREANVSEEFTQKMNDENFVFDNQNRKLFLANVELTKNINELINDNKKNIDLTEEREKLEKLVKVLGKIDRENDYTALETINTKLLNLKKEVTEKIDSRKSYNPIIVYGTENKNTNKEETKTNNQSKQPVKVNAVVVKPLVKEETKTESVDDYSRVTSKISLIDEKIKALQEKESMIKINIINEEVRKVDKIDTIINNAELFASKLHLPENRRPKKVREMGNEFNLDTKEINDYKIEKEYRLGLIDEAENQVEEIQKQISDLEAEKEECNNEYINVKIPNQYAKDGFLEMRMRKSEYETRMKKSQLLDERIALIEEKKAREERIAKLKAELMEAGEDLTSTETALTKNSEELNNSNKISEYNQEIIRSFHKSL